MTFLARLPTEDRTRFAAAGAVVQLPDGAFLLRRGDAGGDLYVVEEGTLEVVESSGGRHHILLVLEPGAVFGDVSFLDGEPRPADVRARGPARVRRWSRADLHALTARDPRLAAHLYEDLARNLARRVRQLADAAVPDAGATPRAHGETGDVAADIVHAGHAAAERLQAADEALRARPQDPRAAALVLDALDALQADLAEAVAGATDHDAVARAARQLRRDLRPWVGRARLVDLCHQEEGRPTVTAEVHGHVLEAVARGEGWLGTWVDRWLLDRPTLVARRAAEEAQLARLATLPTRGRTLFLDALVRHRLDRLAEAVGPGPLVLVDPSPEALAAARRRLTVAAPDLPVEQVTEGVVHLALGRIEVPAIPTKVVLLFDLLDYLPDRIAISVLRWTANRLDGDGCVLAATYDAAPDEALLAVLLGWPTIRRSPARVQRVAAGAGLEVAEAVELGVGRVVVLRPAT